jgi:uncharacterized protein (TIGR00297 family)
MIDWTRLVLSLLLALVVGGLGYWRGSLTRDGWMAATIVGTATAGLGGWEWGILVIVFFVTSSMLSRLGRRRKAQFVTDQWEKTDRRDWGQVAANGGLVSVLGLAYAVWPHPSLWYAAIGVLATVNGDTWATEVGVLSRAQPRLITSGKTVPTGTSGGITVLGSVAAMLGALLIGVSAAVLDRVFRGEVSSVPVIAALLGGVCGVATDSVLGATVQAIRWCPRCEAETERMIHGCRTPSVFKRGWLWLNNDVVNTIASIVGGLTALAVVWLY